MNLITRALRTTVCLVSLSGMLLAAPAWGQTVVFSDDFTVSQGAAYTTSGEIGTSGWFVLRSGDDFGARIDGGIMTLTNTASETANADGWVFSRRDAGAFVAPYETVLEDNEEIISWTFNMRQPRNSPTGFGGGGFGVAFILAATHANVAEEGSGYAIVHGGSGNINPIRLAKFSGGINSLGTSQDGIIVAGTPMSSVGTTHLSIRVTYDPVTNEWTMDGRLDGSSFNDPESGVLRRVGTGIDGEHVHLDMTHMGAFWHSGTALNQNATFDNVTVRSDPRPAPQIVEYCFDGNTVAPTAQPGGIDASNFQVSAGEITFGSSEPNNWGGCGVPFAQSQGGWAETSPGAGKYYSFTVDGLVDATFSVEEVRLAFFTFASGPSALTVYVNGTEVLSRDVPHSVPFEERIDVSGFGFDDLSQVEVRIVGWDNGSRPTTGGSGLRVNDVQLRGTVEGADAPVVTFAESSGTTGEGDPAALTVELENGASETITVDVVLIDGDPDWFTPSYVTQTVTFEGPAAHGETRTVDVTSIEPMITNSDAVFELQNVSGGPDALIRPPSTFTLTIEAAPPGSRDVIFSYWHFNDPGLDPSWPQPVLSDRGRGEITYTFTENDVVANAGTALNARFGAQAQTAFGVRGGSGLINNGRHFDLHVSTVGLEDLVLRFATGRDGTSFNEQSLSYSLDGAAFDPLATFTTFSAGYVARTLNLSGIAGLNDAETVVIRFTLDGSAGETGTNRFDNITLEGNLLPDARLEDWHASEDRRGWRMLSAAMTGMTVADLANLSLVQGLTDEYPQAMANVHVGYDGTDFVPATLLDDDLEPGRGFLWFLWETPSATNEPGGDSRNTGLPLVVAHTGSAPASPVNQTFSRPAGDGWFLIGNPFDEPFDVNDITVDNGDIQNTLYHWNPVTGAYEELERNLSDEANVWDGLFAEVDAFAAGDVTFTFTQTTRSGNAGSPPADYYRVALALDGTVSGQPAFDRNASVVFTPDADEGWDVYDSSKLYPVSSMWAIINMMGDRHGEHVAKAIESRPLPDGQVSVPVAFSSLAGGEFTISLGERTTAPEDWTIELEDTLTGEVVDLRTGSISFTLDEAVWMDERFIVHTQGSPVSTPPGGETYEFALEAAYPNPFSASATVAFTLPEAADVSLAVYDVLGRRVALLAEGEHAAGRHTLGLDGGALASGVYVLRLSAGQNVQTQRVTVVR